MAIRIPTNQIQYKYTIGNEYMVESTYREYQGYYYEINGKLFVGKEFDSNAPELIPIPKDNSSFNFNSLLTKAATYAYGKISGVNIPKNNIKSIPPPSIDILQILDAADTLPPSFYCKKITTGVIKEIEESTYSTLQSDPLYVTTYVGIYKGKNQPLTEADKNIPGLLDWVTFDLLDVNNQGSTC